MPSMTKPPLSRHDRKTRACRRLRLCIPALGITVKEAAQGPVVLKKRWPRGLGRSARMVWYWLSTEPDHPMPAGKALERLEVFLEEALQVLRKRKIVRKSIEELESGATA